MRARLIYEKRGGACFVPHVALADLFSRAARRAGLRLCSTEGFSPHAKMSFGPELPAGVVALWEAVDLWLTEIPEEETLKKETLGDASAGLVTLLNQQMPQGFRVKKCVFPAEGAPALGKECKAAHYRIWPRNPCFVEKLAARARSYFGEDALLVGVDEKEAGGKISPGISCVLANPAKNGLGGWVKTLVAEGLASGWQDLCFARIALGRWNGVRVEPLTEEGVECFRIECFRTEK